MVKSGFKDGLVGRKKKFYQLELKKNNLKAEFKKEITFILIHFPFSCSSVYKGTFRI